MNYAWGYAEALFGFDELRIGDSKYTGDKTDGIIELDAADSFFYMLGVPPDAINYWNQSREIVPPSLQLEDLGDRTMDGSKIESVIPELTPIVPLA